jgi:hypothetical protein
MGASDVDIPTGIFSRLLRPVRGLVKPLPSDQPVRDGRRRRLAGKILMAVAGFAAAGSTWLATSAASAANDSWQGSVRAQQSRDKATEETIREVFQEQAPQALRVRAAMILGDELRRVAGPATSSSLLNLLAAAQQNTADAYMTAYEGTPEANPLLGDRRYRPGRDGIPQVRRYLVDQLASAHHGGPSVLRPLSAANRAARRSALGVGGLLVSAVIAVTGFALYRIGKQPPESRLPPANPAAAGLALLALAVVAWRAVRSRLLLPLLVGVAVLANLRTARASSPRRAGDDEPPQALLGPPEMPPTPPGRSEVRWPELVLALAVLAAIATAGQIYEDSEQDRHLAEAARAASTTASAAVMAGLLTAMPIDAEQQDLMSGQNIDDITGLLPGRDARTRAQAAQLLRARTVADHRTADLAKAMTRLPTIADGIDPADRAVLSGAESSAVGLLETQNLAVAAAARTGDRADQLVHVLFVVTIVNIVVELWPLRQKRPIGRGQRGGHEP